MDRRAQLDCGPDPFVVRQARSFVAQKLREWSLDEWVEVATLCTSEVITNAIVHARSSFRLTIEQLPTQLRFSVQDHSVEAPKVKFHQDLSDNGRGLLMLDLLASEWGYRQLSNGKIVWFAFALAASSSTCP